MTRSTSEGSTSTTLSLIERKILLAEFLARTKAERKRKEAELKAAVRRQQTKSAQKSRDSSNCTSTPKPTPASPSPSSCTLSTIGTKELSDVSILLLKSIYSRLGFDNASFVGFQAKVMSELASADFAWVEREMLCNELVAARAEIDMLKAQNTKLPNPLDSKAEDLINRAMDSQAQAHKTLGAERAKFESNIRRLKDEIKALKADQVDAKERIDSLSNKLERAEKARVEALRCPRHRKEAASPRAAPSAKPPTPSRPAVDDEALKKMLYERILVAEEKSLGGSPSSKQSDHSSHCDRCHQTPKTQFRDLF
ncbi:uncharacterized protein PGTG_17004 [Puccinia graminis f. sp. tritici CRL 75-36-700-3]|uniref:Uncharacterized protein n=1 Tax=Puccinia graminis f. sp. tritici (strain CRL 75-36-700-3 / race SCCL) TaxID=418459 RepID=E3L475_PUCGT|nr:uncharacterized protein PGTG_17004 [Puccinia graminis f. sp. tritici CRL 75-36-700-3]EFP91350.1 hypothetical protein PGTG_17004 [Puccinia graminis f. sp. tritici CRL 75-36-700-3]